VLQESRHCAYPSSLSLAFLKPRSSQVLEDSDSETEAKILKHTKAYSQEQEPLLDSAISYGGKPRTVPLPRRTFTPVGHICLGRVSTEYETAGFAKNEESLYWISNFYVSRALQGSGLGRAAMDTVENLAISEPLCAKTLALNAINKDDPEREENYKALGLAIPPASCFWIEEGMC
jgi:GNAT superfamily N-acetyltransferase